MIEAKAIKRLGNLKEEENLRFRQFLKMNADPDKLDRQFKELHNKYFKIYDCSKCRNCCRELGTVITEDELDAITKTLHIDKEKFKKKYLEEDDDRYKFKTKSCQFLNNNNCKVKNVYQSLVKIIHLLIKKIDYIVCIVLLVMQVYVLLSMKY